MVSRWNNYCGLRGFDYWGWDIGCWGWGLLGGLIEVRAKVGGFRVGGEDWLD